MRTGSSSSGSLTCRSAPTAFRRGGTDDQSPHTEDEIYVITAGRATLTGGGDSAPVGLGDVAYVAAAEKHRFVDITEDFAALVFFAPAEEARGSAEALLAAAEDAMAKAASGPAISTVPATWWPQPGTRLIAAATTVPWPAPPACSA